MGTTDAFSAQIVELVRKMPDEAILELVKHQLGALGNHSPLRGLARSNSQRSRSSRTAAPQATAKSKRASLSPKRRPGRPRKAQALSEERQRLLNDVERIVKAGAGMSASEVAKSAGVAQTRVAAALKELKLAKRIFQGGDRRFARYAGDAKAAELASTTARKNAAGPTTPGPKKSGRTRKSAHAVAAK